MPILKVARSMVSQVQGCLNVRVQISENPACFELTNYSLRSRRATLFQRHVSACKQAELLANDYI